MECYASVKSRRIGVTTMHYQLLWLLSSCYKQHPLTGDGVADAVALLVGDTVIVVVVDCDNKG